MFYAQEIKKLLNERPFRPLRVQMSNGEKYEIPHHDAAFVTDWKLEIGLDLTKEGLARRSINCNIGQIATIEELQATSA